MMNVKKNETVEIASPPPAFAKAFDDLCKNNNPSGEYFERQVEMIANELAAEKERRLAEEKRVFEGIKIIADALDKRNRKNRTKERVEYSEFTSTGKRKARPAESIRSYEDFAAIQNYFLQEGRIRDWMLWTVGVSLGLRISDLLSLKIKDLLNENLTFREKLNVIERKTGKLNNCLITESVVDAVTKYFDSIKWKFKLSDYLFKSRKQGKMSGEYGWRILSDAGKACNLPIIIGSHTMRKSFANIVNCVDKTTVSSDAYTKIQGLLNHRDPRTSMQYMSADRKIFDEARITVSNFVLGKTDTHELVSGVKQTHTIEDVMSAIEALAAQSSKEQIIGD
jgi:integrase